MNNVKKKSLYKVYSMSDTEEVVITRTARQPAPVKNTKPEIAREKLKEKRERLKKEKENYIIEEAKKRLASDTEKKIQDDAIAKQKEEEKKNSDPTYMMMKRMEEMMAMLQGTKAQPAPEPIKTKAKAKKVVIEEPEEEPEPEPEEKPKRKPRTAKQIADKPNKSPGLPKPRKKVVYLQEEPEKQDFTATKTPSIRSNKNAFCLRILATDKTLTNNK
jgi:hypothetical protein